MKKKYFSSILLALLVASGYAQTSALGNQMTALQRSKLNIALLAEVNKVSMHQAAAKARAKKQANTAQAPAAMDEEPRLSILVEVAEGADPVSVLQQHGVEPTAHIYQYASAKVTLSQLQEMAADGQVVRMERPGKVRTMLHHANADTGVDRIHAGSGEDIHTPYTGKGVLALVEDIGFQPGHQMLLDENGKSKVEMLVDSIGNVYTTDAEMKAYKNAENTHGTHVISILAGSKVVDTAQQSYEGVAPGAKLALFDTPMDDESAVKHLQSLEEYASSQANANRPKVMSFSIGGMVPAMFDGTGIDCSILAEMGKKWPICASAGNYGDSSIYNTALLYEYTEASKPLVTVMPVNLFGELDLYKPFEGAFYFASDKGDADVSIRLYDAELGKTLAEFDVADVPEREMTVLSSREEDEGALRNDIFAKYQKDARISYGWERKADGGMEICIELENITQEFEQCKVLFAFKGHELGQVIRGSSADYESYYLTESPDKETSIQLTSDGYISSWALAPNVIAVGSYNTSTYGSYEEGYLSRFSSYMTHTPDNRLLPYVCAPGLNIKAALNRWTPSEYVDDTQIEGSEDKLVGMSGTSMSSPYMAGVIALWLEANPNLTPADVKDIIAKTARRDECVEAEPEQARWGYGKVDAYAGLKEALNRAATSLHAISQDKDFMWRQGAADGQLEAYVAGETALTARLINMEGKVVAQAHQPGNTITLHTPQHAKGVYVLEVMGQGRGTSHKAKIVLR